MDSNLDNVEDAPPSIVGRRFGTKNQLQVVGITEERDTRGARLYRVRCDLCHSDEELFPEDIKCPLQTIKSNCEPCGCCTRMRWSKDQYILKIRRECIARGLNLISVDENWCAGNTKIRLMCTVCGMLWKTLKIGQFLRVKGACRSCSSREKGNTKTDEHLISKFKGSGSFSGGYVIWRDKTEHEYRKQNITWMYKCPICSGDEYVKAGLCSGIFLTRYSSLIRGSYSCRCGKSFLWTQAQREYQINKKIESEKLDYSFVKWVDESYKDSTSKIVLECGIHGKWATAFSTFHNQGSGCPSCSVSGFKHDIPAAIYVILVINPLSEEEFTGFGITNDIKIRIGAHKRNLKRCGFILTDMEIFNVDHGSMARKIERAVAESFPLFPQKVEGFKTEATYAYHYDDVVDFIERKLDES